MYDYVVIGGGILGLATARELGERYPNASLAVLEKESSWARHQSGHNSGVIHAGVYYAPGSLKAKLGVAGNSSMLRFCREHAITHDVCGKVIVATDTGEIGRLDALFERGTANGLDLERLDAAGVRELEPHVNSVGGIHVRSTAVADFAGVCRRLAELVAAQGGDLMLNTKVMSIESGAAETAIETSAGTVKTRFVVNCAGLHSDRIARAAKLDPGVRIVPFRGEYYSLKPAAADLVKTLIYPVPDPDFPFLGVHLTRMFDGSVHAGPNAVLATSREGYRKRDFNARDFGEVLHYRGFWRLASTNLTAGAAEVYRSLVKRAFVSSLKRLVPEITAADVERSESGVRAQALLKDGRMADDFLIVQDARSIHVCNAPSPAATASLEIAKTIADRVAAQTTD